MSGNCALNGGSGAMSMRILGVAALLGAATWSATTASAATLAQGGRTDYTIVFSADASPTDRFAAEELKTFLYGVTVNTVTWTSGDNMDVYRKLWDVGFDHFTTDYPYALFPVVEEIRKGASAK